MSGGSESLARGCRAGAYLDDPFHHAHHLVDHSNDLVRALRGADVGSVLARQYVPTRHVQRIGRGQLKMHCGAIGIIYDGR
jgi:hypothetical protein